ncbi:hypothetical protein Tco_0649610 [Tanacetum coccineum]
MGEGSAMPTDPHHTPIITQPSSSQPQRKQKSRRSKRKDTEVPQPSDPTNIADEAVNEEPSMQLKELMDFCTKLQQRVLDLENTKTAQAQEFTSLKLGVKKLENNGGSRTHKLRRLYKVGRSARVVSSDEASLGDQEDASKQGRKIDDIDADARITLDSTYFDADIDMFGVHDLDGDEVVVESEVVAKKKDDEVNVVEEVVSVVEETVNAAIITEDEITLAQALAELKSIKPKVTTATTTTTKGILLQEPSESIITTTIPSKDNGKSIMVEEPLKMKKKDQINFDEQEAIRLQAEFDKEVRLAREKDKANVALIEEWNDIQAKIDADYQMAKQMQAEEQEELSIEEKSKLFVQLLEAGKKHLAVKRAEEKRNRPPTRAQQRSIMCTYLKNMVGWKPKDLKNNEVRAKGSETIEESSSKRAGDELEQEKAKNTLCEVSNYYLLVEKMYPLTKHTLHQMFNDVKLQVDYECEMAFELLRLVKKQLKEGYGRIVGIKSLLEVTAVKLVLLVQKLLLLVLKVNAAGIKVTTAERIKTAQRKDKDCLWDMYEIFL